MNRPRPPSENAISIVHHGRDRDRLLNLVYQGHERECGDLLLPGERFEVAQRAICCLKALRKIAPDTHIRAESILKYIDVTKANAPDFLFDRAELTKLVKYARHQPAYQLDAQAADWLLGRGVTHEQLGQFRSISQFEAKRTRVVLGAEIHPALQEWVGQAKPEGVIWPWTLGYGTFVRLLSTVPKLKFGASVPLLHIASNVDELPEPTEGHRVWLVEGLFDGLALDRLRLPFCAPSSGTWSEVQLFVLISHLRRMAVKEIVAAHDNDRVGLLENLFLAAFLGQWWPVRCFCYPPGVKDMAELVCREKQNPADLPLAEMADIMERFLQTEYKPLVDYDLYLDHRQTAYSNSNYAWR